MRPRELILDGFRSYAGATTISWEDRSLVGIVGPIGSGKSSILDGICFALYGKTPRLGAETRALINQRRNEGKVSFSFTVDGTEWKVVRALRRKGQSAHTLYRVDGGEDEEVSDKAREVTERVTALLGLDYDGFRRSILLAQGDFAEFLLAKESERNQVLRGVFGFERLEEMRDSARRHRDEAAAGLTVLARLRERADQDRLDLATTAEEQEAAAAGVARLEAAREPMAAVASAVTKLDEEQRALDGERTQMTELTDRIPDRNATEKLLQAREDAAGRLADAEAAASAAAEQERAAAAESDRVVEVTGGRDALADAGALLARLTEQQRAAARSEQAEAGAKAAAETAVAAAADDGAAAAAARAAVAQSEQRTVAAEETLKAAESAVHEATHRDLAVGLRRDLSDGDRCPVCDQAIETVPPVADSGLDAARAALASADAAAASARKDEGLAARRLAEAEAAEGTASAARDRTGVEAKSAAEAAAGAAAAVAATVAALAEAVGEGDDPAVLVAARKAELDRAEEGLASARKAAASAAAAVEDVRRSSQESADEVGRLATRLADLAGRLGHDVALEPEPQALREALAALREAWVERVAAIDARLEEIGKARAEREGERTTALESAGLGAGDDLDAAILTAREQKAALDARVEDLAARLADLTRLETEQGALVTEHDRYQRLVDDLAPSRFPTFVLEDRRRALAALGSERFEYLSAGRYRFTDDGEFDIIDLTAADLTRAAASLSGGETFLASLALALALAEIVAREGGRLDAFFLDEGFGSLDPEHIDLAMAGIERLVTEGADRLIVVVSHVAGLRERIEDLIVLAKDEVTGDTAVRSGAAAGG